MGISTMPKAAVALALWGASSRRAAVHPAPMLPFGRRPPARLPCSVPGSAAGSQRQRFARPSLHGRDMAFHLALHRIWVRILGD